jgi:hypothetical protein
MNRRMNKMGLFDENNDFGNDGDNDDAWDTDDEE